MSDDALELLFEEGPCFVVNKPAGLLTQGPPEADSVAVRFKAFLKRREAKAGNVYLGVPHRLDRPVSGALLLARHVRAARRLAQQFEARTIRKVYWACVEGMPETPQGTWRDFVRKVPDKPWAEAVDAAHPDARDAVLHYRVLGETPCGALLQIELETGRMHQIRLQAATRGLPILGDALYGSRVEFGEQFEDGRLRGIALHGRRLEFLHPMSKEPRQVDAPPPASWQALACSVDLTALPWAE